MIEQGASIKTKNPDGRTVLIWAIMSNPDPELISLLIKKGVDINAVDRDGHSALFFARELGQKENVKRLIKAGARL